MFRTSIIRQCNPVWVCKLTDIVTSLWLETIKLDKEWFSVILLYGNILETNIWNKWESESVNRSLTLINQQLLWKKKGTGLNSKQKISKSSVLRWYPIGSYSSDDPQEKKNLKFSLWAKTNSFGCELWWIVNSDRQFCGTVYVISWTVVLISSSSEYRIWNTCLYHSKTLLVKQGTFLYKVWRDLAEKRDILNTGNLDISGIWYWKSVHWWIVYH